MMKGGSAAHFHMASVSTKATGCAIGNLDAEIRGGWAARAANQKGAFAEKHRRLVT